MFQGKVSANPGQYHLPDITSFGPAIKTDTDGQKADCIDASSKRASVKLREHLRKSSVQTQTSPSISSSNSSSSASSFDLPPVSICHTNSALVHPRASVSDHLAVASARTGASLPLMIGNRSKCVVNLLDEQEEGEQQKQQQQHLHHHHHHHHEQIPHAMTNNQPVTAPTLGPQNTALRAEQRRQNMSVSVVRPVIKVNTEIDNSQQHADSLTQYNSISSQKPSLLDDWMAFDSQAYQMKTSHSLLDELLAQHQARADKDNSNNNNNTDLIMGREHESFCHQLIQSEQQIKQQTFLLKREEHELARGVRRQHQFMVQKLEERKRHLHIIQSVWAQRDFRHAIEKLVDIYQQGLIFTSITSNKTTATSNPGHNNNNNNNNKLNNARQSVPLGATQLRSLNTSLAVDVIGIIILRPRLWTLDICQLLLPIINQDLLLSVPNSPTSSPRNAHTAHPECYTEVGLKALHLILTNFSSIIKSTLESLKESSKLVGVDLSREDRINKCLACYKLLLDSRSILSSVGPLLSHQTGGGKLAAQHRELQTMFSALFSSIQLEPNVMTRRLQSQG